MNRLWGPVVINWYSICHHIIVSVTPIDYTIFSRTVQVSHNSDLCNSVLLVKMNTITGIRLCCMRNIKSGTSNKPQQALNHSLIWDILHFIPLILTFWTHFLAQSCIIYNRSLNGCTSIIGNTCCIHHIIHRNHVILNLSTCNERTTVALHYQLYP